MLDLKAIKLRITEPTVIFPGCVVMPAEDFAAVYEEVERLQGKLSKTKDGVHVGLGDRVWKLMPDGPHSYPIVGVGTKYFVDLGYGIGEKIGACYSTFEAAQAAEEGGE